MAGGRTPVKLLIIRIGAVGDVVMALAAVEAARSLERDTRVTWLCGELVRPLLEHVGTVEEIIAVDDRALLRGTPRERTREIGKAWRALAGRRFDLVVTMHADRRYRILAAGVRARMRRTLRSTGGRPAPIAGRYEGDEYARLVHAIDGPDAPPARLPRVSFPPVEHLLPAAGTTVMIAPGGAKNVLRDDGLRRWPLESYAEVAADLVARGVRVVISGGPGDGWIRPAFAGIAVVDLVGRTDLLELGGTIQACDLLITHDSGPMHLGFLARTPTVALFGPTRPTERLPHGARVRALWGGAHLACRPCYDGRDYAPCPNNVCIQSIAPTDVVAAAVDLISPRRAT
jgi:heptosyltransferase II